MKQNIFATLLAVILTLCVPGNLLAGTLGLTTEAPTFESSLAFIDYFEFAPDGDLSTFGAEVDFVDGVSPVGFTEIGFGVGFSLADPTVGATGGFDVFDEDGLFLAGNLIAVGFFDDVIELQFNELTGVGASSFGSSALVQLAFFDALGPNPLASLVDGDFYEASITVSNVTTVPAPAPLLLFLSGLISLGWIGRRRSNK